MKNQSNKKKPELTSKDSQRKTSVGGLTQLSVSAWRFSRWFCSFSPHPPCRVNSCTSSRVLSNSCLLTTADSRLRYFSIVLLSSGTGNLGSGFCKRRRSGSSRQTFVRFRKRIKREECGLLADTLDFKISGLGSIPGR